MRRHFGCGNGAIQTDDLDAVILCLPPFTSEECSEALVGYKSNALAAVYNGVMEFIGCFDFVSNGSTFVMSRIRYDAYERKPSGFEHLESIRIAPSIKKRWWGDAMTEESDDNTKKARREVKAQARF